MFTILLAIIYVSFISLGLPDALLGSAWPSMYGALQVPISYAGIVSMIISGGTIISSLFCDKLLKKLGVGVVTAGSVCITAIALFGFSTSHSFILLCLWAIPYGLGAGSVDAALNNFVALHYKAHHMSWLHCFWGVGASAGPYIMGYCLTRNLGWNSGYKFIFIIQICLTAVLFFSLPLWKKSTGEKTGADETTRTLRMKDLIKIPGAKPALVVFFCYCGLEATTGLWGSSYMVTTKGIPADIAAKWISLFYLGITIGRFLSGFVTLKISSRNMVRIGQGLVFIGIVIFMLPFKGLALCAGLMFIGIGCAPIYPSMLHSTPENFGKDISQSIMGMQMACAYIGSTLMPPIVGLISEHISMKLYPLFLFLLIAIMVIMAERLNKIKKQQLLSSPQQ